MSKKERLVDYFVKLQKEILANKKLPNKTKDEWINQLTKIHNKVNQVLIEEKFKDI